MLIREKTTFLSRISKYASGERIEGIFCLPTSAALSSYHIITPPLYIFFLILFICRGMRENNFPTHSSAIHKNPLHVTNVRRWTHKAEASYLYVCKFLQVLSNDTWDPSVSYMWICCHPKLKICFQKVFTRRSLVSGKSQRPALSFLLGVTLHLREGGKHLRRISNKFASS